MGTMPKRDYTRFRSVRVVGSVSIVGAMVLLLSGCHSPPPPEPKLRMHVPETGASNTRDSNTRIIRFGTIVLRSTHSTFAVSEAPDKGTEVNRVQPIVDQQTDRIAAIQGNRFGFLFEITGLQSREPVRLKRVVKHPPQRLFGGGMSTETVDELPLLLPTGGKIQGYITKTFDSEREMVPGKWSLEVWRGDTKLVGQEFTVFATRPLPTGPGGSYDLDAVWGAVDGSGLQLGLAAPENGMLAVNIRNQGSNVLHYSWPELLLHPGLKLYVRGPGGPWTLLQDRRQALKERISNRSSTNRNSNAIGSVAPGTTITEGLIALKPGRRWNCTFAVSLSDFEWPVLRTGEVELRVDLNLDSPGCTNCWRGQLNSGVLMLPTTALIGSSMTTAPRAGPIAAKIVDYGTYQPVGNSRRVLHPEIANKSLDLLTGAVVFQQRTDRIPGILNTHFGYTFEVRGLPPGTNPQLTYVTSHPPIQTPDGRILTQHRWNGARPAGSDGVLNSFMGYSFEEDFEIVSGDWLMEVLLDGKPMLRKKFVVFNPNQAKSSEVDKR